IPPRQSGIDHVRLKVLSRSSLKSRRKPLIKFLDCHSFLFTTLLTQCKSFVSIITVQSPDIPITIQHLFTDNGDFLSKNLYTILRSSITILPNVLANSNSPV